MMSGKPFKIGAKKRLATPRNVIFQAIVLMNIAVCACAITRPSVAFADDVTDLANLRRRWSIIKADHADKLVGRHQAETADLRALVESRDDDMLERCHVLAVAAPAPAKSKPVKAEIRLRNADEEFKDSFTRVLVIIYCERGNRDRLVAVLVRYCPARIYFRDVECWLTFYSRETLDHGILVLCDAFEKCTDEKNKKAIATQLRQGFRAFGLDSEKTDEVVVGNIRKWYEANSFRLEPNVDYAGNPKQTADAYQKIGLFIEK